MEIEKDGIKYLAIEGVTINGYDSYLIVREGGIHFNGSEFIAEPECTILVKEGELAAPEVRKAGYTVNHISQDMIYEEEEMEAELAERMSDDTVSGCSACPDDECTGHCFSCSYR